MKFETTTRALRDLVREFHTGAILLPQFQRDYVWKPAKIRNLLDSLVKGFPIGGFYLWRPNSGTRDPKQKAMGEQRITAEFVGYLIDGQQRLTSLEAAFDLYSGEDKDGSELRCYVDLAAPDVDQGRDTRLFVSYAGNKSVSRRVDNADSTLVPLHLLFDGRNFDLRKSTEEALGMIRTWNAKRVEAAMMRFDRACDMLEQQVPCTTVKDVSDREAVEVFSRLNKGGTALRQGDVRAAELARGKAVDVLKKMREFVTEARPERLGFGFSFAFRALVLFHRENAQFSRLKPDWMETSGPHGRSLAQSWRATEYAIKEALSFVDERMGWSRRALVPSANAIIVLAAALDKGEFKLSAENEQLYRRWLCLTALRGVFQGSVETVINRFHRAIRETKKNSADALIKALTRDESRRIRAEEFNKYANMWGPATQVMHAYLVGCEAKDWIGGDLLDVLARDGVTSLPGGDLTVHHLFARKALVGFVEYPDDANCPANYGLLSRSSNAELGDKRPDEVLALLSPDHRQRASLQFFGEGAGDRLKPENYEEFCQWRADRLVEVINEWLGID
ncbi:MAG: DUF262 domain-containing protein [Phycisphaeraceae bacterium]